MLLAEAWVHYFCLCVRFFLILPFPSSFIFIFVFSTQLQVSEICHLPDSNHRSLLLDATALPTEPQPLPKATVLPLSVCTITVVMRSILTLRRNGT